MTEIEKIAYAKSFIDKLANGINPLDDKPIPEGDIVNNVRLSRCFFYVSDILRQVVENGGINKSRRAPKIPFSLTAEQIGNFNFSADPIPVSELAKKIYAAAENATMEKLSHRQISQWLLDIGMLQLCDFGGKSPVKRPTEHGAQIGITVESRTGQYGVYHVVLYSTDAQRFILDNIEAVIATEVKKSKSDEQT